MDELTVRNAVLSGALAAMFVVGAGVGTLMSTTDALAKGPGVGADPAVFLSIAEKTRLEKKKQKSVASTFELSRDKKKNRK